MERIQLVGQFCLKRESPDDGCPQELHLHDWVNAFDSISDQDAVLIPVPDAAEWHPCTADVFDCEGDPRMNAILVGTLEEVKDHFKEPRDLLSWLSDPADDGHVTSVHAAMQRGDVDILKHLLQLSPKYFYQLLGMVTESNGIPRTPLNSVVNGSKPERSLAVISWMCSSGVMTDTLFTKLGTDYDLGFGGYPEGLPTEEDLKAGGILHTLTAVEQVRRKKGMEESVKVLEEWQGLPDNERKGRTEALLAKFFWTTAVCISAQSLPASGTVDVECRALSGDVLATVNMEVSASDLLDKIAAAIDKPKDSISVILPNGTRVNEASATQPLNVLLGSSGA